MLVRCIRVAQEVAECDMLAKLTGEGLGLGQQLAHEDGVPQHSV